MTPNEFKKSRKKLGLSQAELATMLGISGDRTIRKWEEGERTLPGPVIVLMGLILEIPAVRKYLNINPGS